MSKINTFSTIAIAIGLGLSATAVAQTIDGPHQSPVPMLGDNIPTVSSEGWAVDTQAKWGVSPIEYIHMEHQFFANLFQQHVGVNEFFHFKELSTKDMVWVVSPNQDTIYSVAVVDARHDFSVTVPDTGDRFISIQVQDFNHTYVDYQVGGGEYEFKAEDINTDYVIVGIRIGTTATPEDANHIVEEYQPQLAINTEGEGEVNIVEFDSALMLEMRGELVEAFQDVDTPFGWVGYSLDDIKNWEATTYVIANSFGLSHHSTAMYTNGFPEAKGGDCYYGKFEAIPHGAFGSVTVYGHDRYLMTNYVDAATSVGTYHHNWLENKDGTFEIMFGAPECAVEGMNFLATPDDNWHFMVRAYQPDVEAMYQYQVPVLQRVEK
ncbi:DUF1254 domain-containing protein [Shewanella waksmanii]|uniref:DUF1254 domain-containing protein n=1 Tax=Shewanella waksmanii TaxID=213783 RepID=UPI003735A0B0